MPNHQIRHAFRLVAVITVLAGVWFSAVRPALAEAGITLAAFGDSLSAGYNLPPDAAFPVRLEAALRDRGFNVTVENSSVSGDTTTAGLARLDWSLGDHVDGVIVELGANDMLRGIDPAVTREALTGIVDRLAERDIPVLLAGMLAAPNMGPDYGESFNSIYSDLAESRDLVFYPFFLDGVAAEPSLNLSDGMHPNPAGVDVIVERILPSVETLIRRIETDRAS